MPTVSDPDGFTADPDDVAAEWRPLTEQEESVAVVKLANARTQMLHRVPSISARVADGTLDPAIVRQVQVAMVLRVLMNPEGKSREQIDDYSYSRDGSRAAGELYVTDAELALLAPADYFPVARTIRLGIGL